MENIDLNQAQQCLPELIDQLLSGDEIIITSL
jgi:antitoxin (DNA-binding transcriptional repressor) of toxin-antitoxin stability system